MRTTAETKAPPAAEAVPKKASHDTAPPKALLDFMVEHWKPASAKLPSTIKGADRFRARRAALSALFPGETLIVPTGHEKIRANDTTFRFRPSSDFYWLTGNVEPDCVLALVPEPKGGHRAVLFVEPNPGKSDSTFFTDRAKGELWVGPRLGVPQSCARYGVDEGRGLPELADFVRTRADGPFRVLRGTSEKIDATLPAQKERDALLATTLSELRLLKDPLELRELASAIAATRRGFEDVIRALPTSPTERWVEGIFGLRARVDGNDVGYGTIAAAGAHACVLHWTRNDGVVRDGDLLLLDAGVEVDTLYTADVTRTLPISGRFSPAQREIYTLVWRSQRAAMAAVKPGHDFLEPHRKAMEVLTEGLCALGILKVPAAEALREDRQLYKRYTLHNTSHMLGLDVHDCAQARMEAYKFGTLKAGMVLTIEPGLYFQLDDLTVPAKYRGIGVRIEDDVLVTPRGVKNLSEAIPTEADAVEAWMASLREGKGPKRKSAKRRT